MLLAKWPHACLHNDRADLFPAVKAVPIVLCNSMIMSFLQSVTVRVATVTCKQASAWQRQPSTCATTVSEAIIP